MKNKVWNNLTDEQKNRIVERCLEKKEKEYRKTFPDRVTSLEILVMDLQNDVKKLLGEIERLHECIDF